MTVIVYSSRSGSSKRYAEALASRTGLEVCEVGTQPSDEAVVFFGWLRKDQVMGIGGVDMSRLIAVGVVGLDSPDRFDRRAVADRNGLKVPIYYLRGWIDRSKLNILDKGVLLAVSVMMKLKGLNEFNTPIFEAMMNGGSFYDEGYLDPMAMFLESRE